MFRYTVTAGEVLHSSLFPLLLFGPNYITLTDLYDSEMVCSCICTVLATCIPSNMWMRKSAEENRHRKGKILEEDVHILLS